MLLAIRCNKESFKDVYFKPGFNAIIAERTKDSTKKDTRNGLGKSSLLQVIHFCLGSNPSHTLSTTALEDWTFTLELEINGKNYSVSRNTKEKNRILLEGDFSDWLLKPEKDTKTGEYIMSVRDWNKILGSLMFGMKLTYPEFKYSPTFRSCISYFIRQNGEQGGFLLPFTQYKQQKEWDIQVNNSFLLGLDWTLASRWQILKDRMKLLSQLKIEGETGILKDMVGGIGELEARKTVLKSRIEKQEEELKSFHVHPQYSRIEFDANKLTAYIHELIDDNVSDNTLLEHYENALKEEKDADIEEIENMYKEVGIVIAENIKKRLSDVKEFHTKIVVNRKEFLGSEITKLKQNISGRENSINQSSEKRAELLTILKTHKALDEYTKLQQANISLISELRDVENQLGNLKKFEQGKSALKIDIELLQQKARISLSERNKIKEEAINLFNTNSEALYESPGTLSIDIKPTGYSFKVDIERAGSHGISNMKIFCYDLMLAQLWANKKISPGFLIHDSILFADVDERQIALALELANKESNERKFQYICTLNSDTIPWEDFSKDFNLKEYVRLTLTDSKPEGCLFGIRF